MAEHVEFLHAVFLVLRFGVNWRKLQVVIFRPLLCQQQLLEVRVNESRLFSLQFPFVYKPEIVGRTKNTMYLLTEWQSRIIVGKYLAGGPAYAMTESQIFSRPAQPNSTRGYIFYRIVSAGTYGGMINTYIDLSFGYFNLF